MAWFVLVLSGVLEAVWAIALGRSEGFTKLVPSIVFFAALSLSMLGLSHAVKTLPTGTAYAVWVGIGASITVVHGMVVGAEPVSPARVLLIAGLVGCVVGLKLVGDGA
ncbi:DMT family transporter [Rubneribacter badeniensis]|uniref:Ligand-binding protein SH3 n=1 Tax=Rubneribacter badeniensis TaxID=2070688 RepID=A0A2K2U2X7_9ACTN|nr:SMR family transporter [Rubneribacter badeniensis]PNV64683.1 ligand-binding protein SH3 [Rubneribacter badeniensis]